MTFRIENSNGIDGRAWRTEYETLAEAKNAMRDALGWTRIYLSEPYAISDAAEARSAYETREERDADETGAHAPRIVERD